MANTSPLESTSPLPPDPKRSISHYIAAFVFLTLVGGIFWYVNRLPEKISPEQWAQQEKEQISQNSYISGTVKEAVAEFIILSLTNAPQPEIRALIAPETKLYQLSRDDTPKRIAISLKEIVPGTLVTVISDEAISNKTTINAIEIIKF